MALLAVRDNSATTHGVIMHSRFSARHAAVREQVDSHTLLADGLGATGRRPAITWTNAREGRFVGVTRPVDDGV